jgi:tRNA dimethylallyltransferase
METKKLPLLVILGPTASGKTEFSLKLAAEIKAEIISADSMQIYRGMDIGTAKPGLEERNKIKHHMLDIVDPDEKFSVADYKKMVDKLIPEIITKGKLPLLVGGSGLYITAVIKGFYFSNIKDDNEYRSKLRLEANKYGNEYLLNKLKEVDPELAKKLHPNDLRRIIRGLEAYKQTGKSISYYKEKQAKEAVKYRVLQIGLNRNREELYQRINLRVDKMVENGLVEEVKNLYYNYKNISSTALQGLGYKEIVNYLKGDLSLEESIVRIKRDTRRFAKRQLTWFKRDKEINWFNLSDINCDEFYRNSLRLIYDNLPLSKK